MTEAMIAAPISHRAFRTLAAVLVLTDFRKGECRATTDAIAKVCQFDRRSVTEDLGILKGAGLIDWERSGPHRVIRPCSMPVRIGGESPPINGGDVPPMENPIGGDSAPIIGGDMAPVIGGDSAPMHYYRDIQSIQSVCLTPACEGDEFSKAADAIDKMAPGSGLSHLPLQLRDQYPAHWYVEAARSAVVKKRLSGPYMLGILKNYARTGGPDEPAPVAAVADTPAPPPRRFETYKQRAKREQRERFLARHAEINRRLDEEEAANAAM